MKHIFERFDILFPDEPQFMWLDYFRIDIVDINIKSLIHENFIFVVLNYLSVILIHILEMCHLPKKREGSLDFDFVFRKDQVRNNGSPAVIFIFYNSIVDIPDLESELEV